VSSTQYTYNEAAALCAGTINGQTGWRLPTQPELSSLYASGAMNGQGWSLFNVWSSTVYSATQHYLVGLYNGSTGSALDTNYFYATCVR